MSHYLPFFEHLPTVSAIIWTKLITHQSGSDYVPCGELSSLNVIYQIRIYSVTDC